MDYNDQDYYRKRERECRAAAESAIDAHIRAVHLDFAAHYARAAADMMPFAPARMVADSN